MANPRTFIGGTVTDVLGVATLPTTAAHLSLQNGSTNKVYTIVTVGFTTTTSAAAAKLAQLLAHNAVGPAGMVSGTAAAGPKPLDGIGLPTSTGQVYSGVTIANTGIWHPVSSSVNPAAQTALLSMGAWTNVRGIYYLQPGGVFSLAVFTSVAATSKYSCYVTWEEA